jgi:transcriptional regulator with XRE-family HTH domain
LWEPLPSPSAGLLRHARMKARATRREMAKRAGVSVSTVGAYERDARQPTMAVLGRLLEAVGFEMRIHLALYDPDSHITAEQQTAAMAPERLAEYQALVETLYERGLQPFPRTP